MKRSPPISIAPYLDIIFRHRVSALCAFALGISATVSLIVMLPNVYRSTAIIVIEPPLVRVDDVGLDTTKTPQNESVSDQLETLAYKAFSQHKREGLIRKYNLYDYRPGASMDARLAEMNSRIDIVVPGDTIVYEGARPEGQSPRILKISFEYEDRAIAQRVTQELADSFVNEGFRERSDRAREATQFLRNQVEWAKARLAAKDTTIKELERRYEGSLPQDLEPNLTELGRLQDQLVIINQQIVAQRMVPIAQGQQLPTSPTEELMSLELELNHLLSEYTNTYPDVLLLKRRISDLRQQIKSKPSAIETSGFDNVDSSQAEERLEREAAVLSPQVEGLKARIAMTPEHGQELSELLRDYDALATEYGSLTSKELAAQISETLEKRHQEERLKLLQPASIERRPTGPNREAIGILGVCYSTFAALAFPFGLYFTDTSYKDPEELVEEFAIPVLAAIPTLDSSETKTGALRVSIASFAVMLLMMISIWTYTHHHL
jgi:protein tyrosine kinase modulator